MKKVLIVFGTRPEAIKMAPLVKEFQKYRSLFEVKVCVTAQHREMLDQVLDFFAITPDYDLNLMKHGQELFSLTGDIIKSLKPVLENFKPDFVFVHGDTTTSMAAAMAAFYAGAKICHVEAGLRTYNKKNPFPEELNRQITARIADYHFVPTETARQNLLRENISDDVIIITGNTVIDALLFSAAKVDVIVDEEIEFLKSIIDITKRLILVTGHRRENHGEGFKNICEALKEIALTNKEVQIIYPVHLNPNVKNTVFYLLSGIQNVKLVKPLRYPAFVWLMKKSFIIITDSGGVQEEAPSLAKPVLVMRDVTERPEAVQTGTVALVGTDKAKIIEECTMLLNDDDKYKLMSGLSNPYGDGHAAEKIVDFIKQLTL